jgi:YHS domain-containing protein
MRPVLAALLLPLAVTAAAAAESRSVNASWIGKVAIHGYDPVAYFDAGRPLEGTKAFTAEWRGATWRFASAVHRDAFLADPEKYAPQYGGWCAWAMTRGEFADVDPRAWRIVEGRLYLNYDAGIQKKWERDVAGHIAAADRQWAAKP